jgi:hypothetical protein
MKNATVFPPHFIPACKKNKKQKNFPVIYFNMITIFCSPLTCAGIKFFFC